MSLNALAILAQASLEGAVSEGMRRVLSVRAKTAFDTLMDEMRAAQLSPEDAAARDDTAAMMLKYFTAMSLGAAANNLRILARILAYKSERPDRSADEFVMWADVIGSLQAEELVFLAMLADAYKDHLSMDDGEGDRVSLSFLSAVTDVSEQLRDHHDIQMIGNRLIATGLVNPIPTADGGNRFRPTRRLWKLVQMARLSEFGPEFADRG